MIGIVPCVIKDKKELYVQKSGSVSAYILSDLKPCIEADVHINGRVIHVDRALFDTGANITVINPVRVPEDTETDEPIKIYGGYSKNRDGHVLCRIDLDGGEIVLHNVLVYISDLDAFEAADIDLIIGMDIITAGTLSIKKKKGNLSLFTFEA